MSKNLWSLDLIKAVNDPTNHVIRSDLAVVIKDKYPKAKQHYLVLPKQDISSVHNLNSTHLPLLQELFMMAVNIIEVKQQKLEDFKIGFHIVPSMQRLHMHVISQDFVSDSLKTKRHWNSFNTRFFINYENVFEQLKYKGKCRGLDKEDVDKLLKQDLKCNQCDFKPNTMPALKLHLLQHFNDKK